MTRHSWEDGQQPWVRRHGGSPLPMRCPFCGGKTLVISWDDIAEDDLRIELYCTNEFCSARTFTIVAQRTDTFMERADQIALYLIDGAHLRPEFPSGRMWNAGALLTHYDDKFVLGRRRGQPEKCRCKHCRSEAISER